MPAGSIKILYGCNCHRGKKPPAQKSMAKKYASKIPSAYIHIRIIENKKMQ
jgi:hypothetical protein